MNKPDIRDSINKKNINLLILSASADNQLYHGKKLTRRLNKKVFLITKNEKNVKFRNHITKCPNDSIEITNISYSDQHGDQNIKINPQNDSVLEKLFTLKSTLPQIYLKKYVI